METVGASFRLRNITTRRQTDGECLKSQQPRLLHALSDRPARLFSTLSVLPSLPCPVRPVHLLPVLSVSFLSCPSLPCPFRLFPVLSVLSISFLSFPSFTILSVLSVSSLSCLPCPLFPIPPALSRLFPVLSVQLVSFLSCPSCPSLPCTVRPVRLFPILSVSSLSGSPCPSRLAGWQSPGSRHRSRLVGSVPPAVSPPEPVARRRRPAEKPAPASWLGRQRIIAVIALFTASTAGSIPSIQFKHVYDTPFDCVWRVARVRYGRARIGGWASGANQARRLNAPPLGHAAETSHEGHGRSSVAL